MRYYSHFITKVATSDYLGGYWTAAVGFLMAFMAPVWPFVLMALVLVIVDTLSGVRAAKKRGEKIRSRKLFRMFEKFGLYFVSITVAEQMRITFFPAVPITHVTALGICTTEFFSMVENVETVTGVNILRRIKKIIPGVVGKDEGESAQD